MCEIRNELGNLISGCINLFSPSTEADYYFIDGICDDDVELTDDLYVYGYNPIYAEPNLTIENVDSYLTANNKTFFTIDFNKSTNDKIILLSANVTVKSESAVSKTLINNLYIRRNGSITTDNASNVSIATLNLKGGNYYNLAVPTDNATLTQIKRLFNCNISKDNETIETNHSLMVEINNKIYANYSVNLSDYSEDDIFTIRYTINAQSKEQSLELYNDTGYIFYLYNATEWQNRAGFINKLRQRHITTKGGIL